MKRTNKKESLLKYLSGKLDQFFDSDLRGSTGFMSQGTISSAGTSFASSKFGSVASRATSSRDSTF